MEAQLSPEPESFTRLSCLSYSFYNSRAVRVCINDKHFIFIIHIVLKSEAC